MTTRKLLRAPRPSPPPLTGGDSASAGASSAAAAPQKNNRKKEKEETISRRQPRRAAGEAAPEPELVKEPARRKPSEAQGSAEATGKMDGLVAAAAASGAEAASAGSQRDGDDDPAPPSRVSLRSDLLTAPGHKNRENQEHESGVWLDKSPTGIELGEEFCKLAFDHSDGKGWATLVFNAVIAKVPAKPREDEYYPSLKDTPRCYEHYSRAFAYVPRIAPACSDIDNTDPNERLFPTQHTFNANRFAGTLLSAVDLVWFKENGT